MWLRNKNIPVYGPRYHSEFSKFAFLNYAYVFLGLNNILKIDQPDFLIIGPQLNPLPFQLSCIASKTRLILSSYDVEAIRMERIAASQKGLARIAMQLEARRARQFERDALQYYDGIIAVSETDKHSYMERYGFEPDRILALDNSVDTKYFSFRPRIETEQPNIVFTASFGYWPNVEAAHRLLAGIMPLVRQHFPSARAWIVGQYPSKSLLALSDGKLNIVTGKVDDVRPFLDMATATCIPLITGSGTKYKVLEAASAGVPVICTSLALEGLSLKPEEHILVGETNRQLADAIMRVIQNPDERVEATQKAFAHIEQHYSWNSNLRKLDPWLEMLKTMPKRSPSTPRI
jgi:glycosyltransferase involved in cell wall biosynthesis